MGRILRDARGTGRNVQVDLKTGLATPTDEEGATGVYYEVEGSGISLRVAGVQLHLQVRSLIFPVRYKTEIRWTPDYAKGTCTFRVEDDERAVEVTYPGWWVELGLDPDDVAWVPERHEEEDFVAFLYETIKDRARRDAFFEKWSTAAKARKPKA